jgi:hypothetical protein
MRIGFRITCCEYLPILALFIEMMDPEPCKIMINVKKAATLNPSHVVAFNIQRFSSLAYQPGIPASGSDGFRTVPALTFWFYLVFCRPGLTRVAQQTNCLTSCTNAAFTNTPANRNVCFQACSLVPQSSCTAACAFATVEPDRVRCRAACNNICPN